MQPAYFHFCKQRARARRWNVKQEQRSAKWKLAARRTSTAPIQR